MSKEWAWLQAWRVQPAIHITSSFSQLLFTQPTISDSRHPLREEGTTNFKKDRSSSGKLVTRGREGCPALKSERIKNVETAPVHSFCWTWRCALFTFDPEGNGLQGAVLVLGELSSHDTIFLPCGLLDAFQGRRRHQADRKSWYRTRKPGIHLYAAANTRTLSPLPSLIAKWRACHQRGISFSLKIL